MTALPPDTLTFPPSSRDFLEPHLLSTTSSPDDDNEDEKLLPFTTLTFATSLDSSLALSPGVRTVLSGPQSKAMTHYLRSRHDAILIGVGTAVADDPGLNCRLEGVGGYGGHGLQGQPRPIVVDPHGRWDLGRDAKILQLAREGKGKAPYVIVAADLLSSSLPTSSLSPERRELLESCGGKYIPLPPAPTPSLSSSKSEKDEQEEGRYRFDWIALLSFLRKEEGVRSVMIEGGGSIINSLLEEARYQSLIDSVIITIAPTWLGQGGVVVSPKRRTDENGHAIPASRLTDVKWYPFGEDVVLCGRVKR